MSKKKNILMMLETHVDKLILGVIGLISLYLLWTLVVSNPYGVSAYGRKFGPGQIDRQNRQQARVLEESLGLSAGPIAYDLRITEEFEDMLRSSLPRLAVDLQVPYPGVGEQVIDDDRVYPVPGITPLSDVQVARVRGAVHLPTEEVTPEIPYEAVPTELGDLDVVTVSGRVDMQALYRNFRQSFEGPRLRVGWSDPTFARPVVARLELQRRQMSDQGLWSQWQTVPRHRIDAYRKLFDQTPMTTEEMEFGGVTIWLNQYRQASVQVNLLQPPAYDFASLPIAWLPPHYMDEAQTMLKRQEDELRRQEREEWLRIRTAGGDTTAGGGRPAAATRERTTQTRPQPQQPQRGRLDTQTTTLTPAQTRLTQRRERTLEDIIRDFERERINEQTRLDGLREPLLVWAHDDSAEPGGIYQYRIRLGVFNPIAGRDWFSQDQQHFKNQVVLWSEFSEATQEVAVPKMQQLFPLELLARDTAGGVKVDVARYYQGQWRTQEFEVFPGQMIGDNVEAYVPPTAAATPAAARMDAFDGGRGMMNPLVSEPRPVDFTTSYMLVDTNEQIQWRGTSRSEFPQMLFYGPEETLLTMAVGSGNWSSAMSREYREIKEAERNVTPMDSTRGDMGGGRMMPRDAARRPVDRMPAARPDRF